MENVFAPQGPPNPVSNCWHVYSDGTARSVLFDTLEDHVFGMNLLPITLYLHGGRIYALVLEETHFHMIIRCQPGVVRKTDGPHDRIGEARDCTNNMVPERNAFC